MKAPRSKFVLLAAAVAVAACAVSAQVPVQNIDPQRHGIANDYRLGGHVNRAKELLREANEEIKLAAEAANRR